MSLITRTRRNAINILVAICLLAVSAVGALPASALVVPSAAIAVTPETQTVLTPGGWGPFDQSFSIALTVSSDAELGRAGAQVLWDPDLVTLESVEEGPFLKDWATANGRYSELVQVSNAPGDWSFDNALYNNTLERVPVNRPAGSGVFVILHMRAVAAGDTAVHLPNVAVQQASSGNWEIMPDPVALDGSVRVMAKLQLTSMCSVDPDLTRRWRVSNYNPYPVAFDWQVAGTTQAGSGTVSSAVTGTPGKAYFETVTIPGSPNTTTVLVDGVQHNTKASGGAQCLPNVQVTKVLAQPASRWPTVGETTRFRVTIQNAGETPIVEGSSWVDTYPQGLSFERAHLNGNEIQVYHNAQARTLTMDFWMDDEQPMLPGQLVTLDLEFTALTAGTGFTNQVEATAYDTNQNTATDSDSVVFDILPPVLLSVDPATQAVPAGESFDVAVRIDSAVALRGAQAALSFDPTVIRVDSVEVGPFFKLWSMLNGAELIEYPEPVIDNGTGTVSTLGLALGGGNPGGPSGSGVLAVYHCTALGEGVSDVTLSDTMVVDQNAAVIDTVQANDGTVSVEAVSMHVAPPAQTVPSGEPFMIDLMIDSNGFALRGAQAALSFDPAVMEIVGYEIGPYFKTWALMNGAELVLYPEPIIDNVNGAFTALGVALGGGNAGGPTGTGVFATLECIARGGGTSDLILSQTLVADAAAQVIENVVVQNGSVTVQELTMSISPADRTVATGDTFTVDLMIDSAGIAVRGAQAGFGFDPAVMEVVEYTAGSFFADWAAANGAGVQVYPEPTIDNVNGTVSEFGQFVVGGSSGGPSGSGVLATFTCRAKGSGTSAIALSHVLAANERAEVIEGVLVNDGSVTVQSTGGLVGDLNGDGVVDISDVVRLGLVWGQTGAPGWLPEDLNADGRIDINDVVVIGLHWGERIG